MFSLLYLSKCHWILNSVFSEENPKHSVQNMSLYCSKALQSLVLMYIVVNALSENIYRNHFLTSTEL